MAGACWTGRVAGEMAADAVGNGYVGGTYFEERYREAIDDSLMGEKTHVSDASQVFKEIRNLAPEVQDRAIAEIGQEVAALHFYSKGCLASSLTSSLEIAQRWLKERKRDSGRQRQ